MPEHCPICGSLDVIAGHCQHCGSPAKKGEKHEKRQNVRHR